MASSKFICLFLYWWTCRLLSIFRYCKYVAINILALPFICPKRFMRDAKKVNLLGHKLMYIFNFKSTPTSSSNRPQAASVSTGRCCSIFPASPMGWLWKWNQRSYTPLPQREPRWCCVWTKEELLWLEGLSLVNARLRSRVGSFIKLSSRRCTAVLYRWVMCLRPEPGEEGSLLPWIFSDPQGWHCEGNCGHREDFTKGIHPS